MLKPRTIFLVAAVGTAAYAFWRWQKQRLIEFDQSLFSDTTANKNLLGGSGNQRPVTQSTQTRPIQTTIHKRTSHPEGERKTRPIQTTVHKGNPPEMDLSPTEPHFIRDQHKEDKQRECDTHAQKELDIPSEPVVAIESEPVEPPQPDTTNESLTDMSDTQEKEPDTPVEQTISSPEAAVLLTDTPSQTGKESQELASPEKKDTVKSSLSSPSQRSSQKSSQATRKNRPKT